jgi:multimeric flavodoxin WrbA
MKIALINGSPRSRESASGCILQEVKPLLDKDNNAIYEFSFKKSNLSREEIEQLTECDALVFVFPLYVDGVPSHLLSCLVQLETIFESSTKKEIVVYSLVNCGFYEGKQNTLALEIIENWCAKTGLKWGQGVGIGAGGMLLAVKNVPVGHGPKKNLEKALKQLSSNILKCASEENIYITANFPRFLYKLSAEMGWRQAIKANGLTRKDLFLKK